MKVTKKTERIAKAIELNCIVLNNLEKSISCLNEIRKRIEIKLVEETYIELTSSVNLLNESTKLLTKDRRSKT